MMPGHTEHRSQSYNHHCSALPPNKCLVSSRSGQVNSQRRCMWISCARRDLVRVQKQSSRTRSVSDCHVPSHNRHSLPPSSGCGVWSAVTRLRPLGRSCALQAVSANVGDGKFHQSLRLQYAGTAAASLLATNFILLCLGTLHLTYTVTSALP